MNHYFKPLAVLALVSTLNLASSHPANADSVAPAATGVLFDPTSPTDIAGLNVKSWTMTVVDANGGKALQAETDAANGFPDFDFPAPAGGWNLQDFGGVKVQVTNAGQTDAVVGLRVDGDLDWTKKIMDVELVKLAPGETKPLSVTFGMSYHNIGYDLDTTHVMRLKIFLSSPKPPTVLTFQGLTAFPKSEAMKRPVPKPVDPEAISLPGFSKGADRDVPVTPPAWIGTRPPVDGDWVQTFNDKFEGTSLNENLWTNKPFGNGVRNQLQFYSKQNVTVANGILSLKAEKRDGFFNEDPKMEPKQYASGYIDTYGKWTQAYGYFEARIKLPTARGLWPAFWMMPDRGPVNGDVHVRSSTYGDGMEFDILEQLTEWGPGRYNVATHWDGYGADHKHWGNSSTFFGPTADGWHTYGLLWEPGKATFYCDGIEKAEEDGDRIGSAPEYFILNVQIGGWATSNVDDANLPDALQVKYVRAWQLKSRLTNSTLANVATVATTPAETTPATP